MAEIAAGVGDGPKPFILAALHEAPPDATWNSNKGGAAQLRASAAASEKIAPATVNSKAVSGKRKPARIGLHA